MANDIKHLRLIIMGLSATYHARRCVSRHAPWPGARYHVPWLDAWYYVRCALHSVTSHHAPRIEQARAASVHAFLTQPVHDNSAFTLSRGSKYFTPCTNMQRIIFSFLKIFKHLKFPKFLDSTPLHKLKRSTKNFPGKKVYLLRSAFIYIYIRSHHA